MRIRLLDPLIANQIAAGEVIERPASVVKELLENSLDAGANKIELDILQGGIKQIRVSDNGCGIYQDDLPLAVQRFGTSKISVLDELDRISTLGFRGEALASLAAVSQLILTSCPIDQENAWQVEITGVNKKLHMTPIPHPKGTTITVYDLFFNTPARRKFMRSEKMNF